MADYSHGPGSINKINNKIIKINKINNKINKINKIDNKIRRAIISHYIFLIRSGGLQPRSGIHYRHRMRFLPPTMIGGEGCETRF